MNRAERRAIKFGRIPQGPNPGTYRWVRQRHELDDDGCCIHCGFDAAEEWHLRHSIPLHSREEKPEWAIFCDRRPMKRVEDSNV